MAKNVTVSRINFGYATAREFWNEVGLPAFEHFKAAPNRATTIAAAVHAWHLNDWLWHEGATDPGDGAAYLAFRNSLIALCPELAWIQDIAEAGKHRVLYRKSVEVAGVRTGRSGILLTGPGGPALLAGPGLGPLRVSAGLEIELTDGSRHSADAVLSRVVEFWQARFNHQV